MITSEKIKQLAEEAAEVAKNATYHWSSTESTTRATFAAEIFKALYEQAKQR